MKIKTFLLLGPVIALSAGCTTMPDYPQSTMAPAVMPICLFVCSVSVAREEVKDNSGVAAVTTGAKDLSQSNTATEGSDSTQFRQEGQ